jgi:hypothetical protein
LQGKSSQKLVLIYLIFSIDFRNLSNDTILETNTNSTNSKKNITVSSETYDRLVSIGKFSDRTFDHLISRLLDEREGRENVSGGNN